ncbi:hypothetical protein Q1695_012584 [Nippostrongylus brasiliensis]|nr:hypothetical protein Q1695_012584 [Nippostrongylus brasiliensis]
MDTSLSSTVGPKVRAMRNGIGAPDDDPGRTPQSAIILLAKDDKLPQYRKDLLGHVLEKLVLDRRPD